MSCQCYKIGGPFIAEDPDCPAHGTEAQRERKWLERRLNEIVADLNAALDSEEPERIENAARYALLFLKEL